MKTYCRLYYRIPFSETDAMAIVHHSNHARYLERGRVEFLRLAELNYADLVKRGVQYPVLEISTQFKKPLVFDDVILIETWVTNVTRTRLAFGYNIFAVGGEVKESALTTEPFAGKPSATGLTAHCSVNAQGRPIEAPPEVLERLQNVFGGI